MSPRIKRIRKILNPPSVKGFKPYGLQIEPVNDEPVNLLTEEYEALRLCDYDGNNQFDASVMMGVSRPTFTRIYASALQKIAKAFVEARQIDIEGGKIYFDSDWYQCRTCHCFFNNPEKNISITGCPLCGSQEIERNEEDVYASEHFADCQDVCVCPQCKYEQRYRHGKSCQQQICPRCGKSMQRK